MIGPGSKLAHYEVVSALGKGGMGEVWRAKDTKLGREVAIKTLPAEFAEDADRLARFEREAKLLASLNHPNIAAIHGFEEDNGTHFLIMELVEGDTLADRVGRGAIPVEESLKLALQIANALKAAHEKGVIHRDLKPANIKVTDENTVKVLDFGLAKAFAGEEAEQSPSNSPTLSMQATQQGVILGTAAYMSPEQAKGRAVDKRADVWAFGCVVYEMLTGHQSFGKSDVTESLAAVISLQPEWTAIPENLHPRLREIVERCLEKQVGKRSQDIGDVGLDIEKLLADPAGVIVAPVVEGVDKAPQSKLPWVAAILGILIATVAVWILKPASSPPPPKVVRFSFVAPEGQTVTGIGYKSVAISPDGTRLVYVASGQLHLRDLAEMVSRPIPGTAGNAVLPTFSPDGESVAYYSQDNQQIKSIAIGGGAVVRVLDVANLMGLTWEGDDSLVLTGREGIMRVPSGGGEVELLVAADEGETLTTPQVLPNGSILFSATTSNENPRWNEARILLGLPDGTRVDLGLVGADATYLPTGHILYARDADLLAVSFDLGSAEVTSGSITVEDPVRRQSLGLVRGATANYGISGDGTLAYIPGASSQARTLVWVDRAGNETLVGLEPADYGAPRLSPDGSSLLDFLGDSEGDAIWYSDLTRDPPTLRKVTNVPGAEIFAFWINEEEMVFYSLPEEGESGLFRARADGTGTPEPVILTPSEPFLFPYAVTPDGASLITGYQDGGTPWLDMGILSLDGDPDHSPLLVTDDSEGGADLSPNGEWLAYVSNQSGESQVYVRRLSDMGALGQVSTGSDGGEHPLWSDDGTELFYRRTSDDALMVVDVDTGPTLRSADPTVLLEGGRFDFGEGALRRYEYDGPNQRFLMTLAGDGGRVEINVVEDFFAVLEERLPVD